MQIDNHDLILTALSLAGRPALATLGVCAAGGEPLSETVGRLSCVLRVSGDPGSSRILGNAVTMRSIASYHCFSGGARERPLP